MVVLAYELNLSLQEYFYYQECPMEFRIHRILNPIPYQSAFQSQEYSIEQYRLRGYPDHIIEGIELHAFFKNFYERYYQSITNNRVPIFKKHKTIKRSNKSGREYLKSESLTEEDSFRHQNRILRLAEITFNLQFIEGLDGRIGAITSGNLEATIAELEFASYLYRSNIAFEFIQPTGIKGDDYDIEITTENGCKVPCEIKTKVENATLNQKNILDPLNSARTQLPKNQPGIISLKIPELWVKKQQIQAEVAS